MTLLQSGVLPREDWTAIRVSYGLCGIIMQMGDLPAFVEYHLLFVKNHR